MFAVGSLVPWARAGVGAVATQAFGEVAYGPRCLDLLAAGVGAETALAGVREPDASRRSDKWRSSIRMEQLHHLPEICVLTTPDTWSLMATASRPT